MKRLIKKRWSACGKNSFGVEALVRTEKLKNRFLSDPPSIEDIMLYFVKEGK